MNLACRIENLRRRDQIVRTIRRFFWDRSYLEVETPHLAATPIPESHLELFATALIRPDYTGVPPLDLFLLPSPEYYIKRLLAAGSGSLFEITHSFRNLESIGPHHNPEFTMLEWYTVGADAADNIPITIELLRTLGFEAPCEVWTMAEAFERTAGENLEALLDATVLTDACRRAGLQVAGGSGDNDAVPAEQWETLFQRFFLTVVEPGLPADRALFLTHYPAAIPTLSRAVPGTPWADRWELYLAGVELANCFGEETDPEVIGAFFAAQTRAKAEHCRLVHPVDPEYLQGSERLPRCSGVALGVDRLVAALIGADSLDQVISFPVSDIIAAANSHSLGEQ